MKKALIQNSDTAAVYLTAITFTVVLVSSNQWVSLDLEGSIFIFHQQWLQLPRSEFALRLKSQ